jgi:hypothetical protein
MYKRRDGQEVQGKKGKREKGKKIKGHKQQLDSERV